MTTLRLSSIEAFTAPLDYHQNAALFLTQAASDLPARATTVVAQLRNKHPQYATQLETAIATFATRLADEGTIHTAAVTYLQSHRAWLAANEATLSGTAAPTFLELTTIVPAWLVVRPMPIASCFDMLKGVLNTYDHALYGADQTLRNFENLIWKLINDPASLNVHVGWSGNPFADAAGWVVNEGAQVTGVDATIQAVAALVRANEGAIRNAIDTVRNGIEFIFLPLVDGQILQDLIDYVQGLQQAYQQHIRQPFVPTTQAFVADYQPPQGQTSYQDSLSGFQNIQTVTGDAFGTMFGQLNSLQNLNEEVSLAQIGATTDGGECLISFAALVAFPPDFEISLPVFSWRAIDLGAILARIVSVLASIAEAFMTIGAILVDAVVAALPIIALTAIAVTVISLAGDSAVTTTTTVGGTIAASKIMEEVYPDVAVRKAISAWLACRFSYDLIQQLLNMLKSALGLAELLRNAAINNDVGAIRVIDFLLQLGTVQNAVLGVPLTEQYGVSVANLVAVSLPVKGGGFPDGDIDVMFRTPGGRILNVEVGGPAKGALPPGVFEKQLLKDQEYAAALGGDFICVLQAVPPGSPAYPAFELAVERAIATIGAGKVYILPVTPSLPMCAP